MLRHEACKLLLLLVVLGARLCSANKQVFHFKKKNKDKVHRPWAALSRVANSFERLPGALAKEAQQAEKWAVKEEQILAKRTGFAHAKHKYASHHSNWQSSRNPFSKTMHKAFGRRQGEAMELADSGATDMEWCQKHRAVYSVIDGVSWGALPKDLRKVWDERQCSAGRGGAASVKDGCPKLSLHTNKCGPKYDNAVCTDFAYCNEMNGWCGDTAGHKRRAKTGRWNRDKVPEKCYGREWCYSVCSGYGVEPDVRTEKNPRSWGSLTEDAKKRWVDTGCNSLMDTGDDDDGFGGGEAGLYGVGRLNTLHDSESVEGIKAAKERAEADTDFKKHITEQVKQRGASERLTKKGKGEVIGIGVACTTRGMKLEFVLKDHSRAKSALKAKVPLFNVFLPSLLRSLAGGGKGGGSKGGGKGGEPFSYRLYVTIDRDDKVLSDEKIYTLAMELVADMIKHAGVDVDLTYTILRFGNEWHKPGPAFNFMMAAAADDGADYLYRVNDDTEFVGTNWGQEAVSQLLQMDPPLVGVVGPECDEGNTNILTHDFVHRTHLQVFDLYYPSVLKDWWMDDWISFVYGAERTKQGPFKVQHQRNPRRYNVNIKNKRTLQLEIDAGTEAVNHYIVESAAA